MTSNEMALSIVRRAGIQKTIQYMLTTVFGEKTPEALSRELPTIASEIEVGFAELYTLLFEEEELRCIVSWNESPVGQKLARLEDVLRARGNEISQEVVDRRLKDLDLSLP
jgi:hypothetical protein